MSIVCLLLMLSVTGAKDETKTIELKVIETTDVHGYFFPYDFIQRKPMNGTMCRVNTYVEEQRKSYGDRLLLFDNGDILQGQPTSYWSNIIKADSENIAASVVNYMKYDLQGVGNHDIEPGHEVFDKWMKEVRCPVVGANIVDKNTRKPYVKPYVMLEREGEKIAVLGMLTPTMSCWLNESTYSGLDFLDIIKCTREWVSFIKKHEHPDLVLCLFHSGYDNGITMDDGREEDVTLRVAKEVPGIDIIFFGHDHVVRNQWVKNVFGSNVLCLNSSCHALNVAEASIQMIYRNGKLVNKSIEGNIVNVSNMPIDEKMAAHFKPQTDAIKQYVDRRIGSFTETITTRDSYFGPSAFTDFIHNIMRQITGAEISINAPLSFDSSIQSGDITVGDMFKLYRFENKLYTMRLKGSEIRKHLEMSYDLWVNTMKTPDDHLLLINKQTRGDQQRMGFINYTFNFDSAAGIDYEVDVTKPNGQKVRILRMSDGKPFDENRWYKVVLNSYRGNGGGELLTRGAGIPKDSLNGRILTQSDLDLRYYIMKEIERQGVMSPKANNNWKFVPDDWVKPAAARDRKLLFKE